MLTRLKSVVYLPGDFVCKKVDMLVDMLVIILYMFSSVLSTDADNMVTQTYPLLLTG